MATEAKTPTQKQIEARAVASARMKAMHEKNRQQKAGATVRDMSDEEVFSAQFAGQVAETEEDMSEATATTNQALSGIASVSHRGPKKIRMYDSEGNERYIPATESSIRLSVRNGFFPVCPKCGSKHTESGFNACPAREPLHYAACPVCARYGRQKLIPDERLVAQAKMMVNDPNYVPIDLGIEDDYKSRVRIRLQAHIIDKHPDNARAMGFLSPQNQQAPSR
jgi:hypothetical protein